MRYFYIIVAFILFSSCFNSSDKEEANPEKEIKLKNAMLKKTALEEKINQHSAIHLDSITKNIDYLFHYLLLIIPKQFL